MLDWLQKNNGAVTAIATLVLAIVTGILAWFTVVLASETKRLRKAQTEPNVLIFVRPTRDNIFLLELVIVNIGGGEAQNIKFDVSEDLNLGDTKSLKDIACLAGIASLAPKQEIRSFLFSSAWEGAKAILDRSVNITVTYEDNEKSKFIKQRKLAFNELKGLAQLDSPLVTISRSLEKMSRA